MGMSTELIFGAELKKETPKEVVEILKAMTEGETVFKKLPKHKFFKTDRWKMLFTMTSYYFGVSESLRKMWFDDISDAWIISTRSNIKNYDSEIEEFLDWIKPHIASGSGYPGFYAIVTYEESEEPTIYYLKEEGSQT